MEEARWKIEAPFMLELDFRMSIASTKMEDFQQRLQALEHTEVDMQFRPVHSDAVQASALRPDTESNSCHNTT
eukprot:11570551-Prorocentrum_lima.AAC.1